MTKIVQAVFENGVLRPLAPLGLPDGQQVQVIVSTEPGNEPTNLQETLSPEEYEACLDALADGLDLPVLPPSAFTREDIYEGG